MVQCCPIGTVINCSSRYSHSVTVGLADGHATVATSSAKGRPSLCNPIGTVIDYSASRDGQGSTRANDCWMVSARRNRTRTGYRYTSGGRHHLGVEVPAPISDAWLYLWYWTVVLKWTRVSDTESGENVDERGDAQDTDENDERGEASQHGSFAPEDRTIGCRKIRSKAAVGARRTAGHAGDELQKDDRGSELGCVGVDNGNGINCVLGTAVGRMNDELDLALENEFGKDVGAAIPPTLCMVVVKWPRKVALLEIVIIAKFTNGAVDQLGLALLQDGAVLMASTVPKHSENDSRAKALNADTAVLLAGPPAHYYNHTPSLNYGGSRRLTNADIVALGCLFLLRPLPSSSSSSIALKDAEIEAHDANEAEAIVSWLRTSLVDRNFPSSILGLNLSDVDLPVAIGPDNLPPFTSLLIQLAHASATSKDTHFLRELRFSGIDLLGEPRDFYLALAHFLNTNRSLTHLLLPEMPSPLNVDFFDDDDPNAVAALTALPGGAAFLRFRRACDGRDVLAVLDESLEASPSIEVIEGDARDHGSRARPGAFPTRHFPVHRRNARARLAVAAAACRALVLTRLLTIQPLLPPGPSAPRLPPSLASLLLPQLVRFLIDAVLAAADLSNDGDGASRPPTAAVQRPVIPAACVARILRIGRCRGTLRPQFWRALRERVAEPLTLCDDMVFFGTTWMVSEFDEGEVAHDRVQGGGTFGRGTGGRS
ncbi:hypothetical protein DFJ73DRAFT_902228 [Zopfochytrium polystomum]|nr:hypothetical protein DFJ73DRAFT_902228 [Zopfochytrium polystomum]